MKNLFKSIFKSSSELRPNIQLPPTAPSSGGRRKRKRDTLKEELHLDDNYDRRRFEICGLFELEIRHEITLGKVFKGDLFSDVIFNNVSFSIFFSNSLSFNSLH